jgi:hypothetical protein
MSFADILLFLLDKWFCIVYTVLSSINLEGDEMQIIFVNGQAVAYSWSTGCIAKRIATLLEQARKGNEELERVCLWLEKHGHADLAEELLERLIR